MNLSGGKHELELTMTTELYSQEKPAEYTLINLLYIDNCYYCFICRLNNGLEVSKLVLLTQVSDMFN